MIIQIDTREKVKAIDKIVRTFDLYKIGHISSKLYVGDYMSLDNPRLVIDRKQNLLEICSNVSSVPKKDKSGHIKKTADGRPMTDLLRFTDELQRAKDAGIKLIILCEHGGGIKSLEDIIKWQNPRLKESPLAMSGERLYTVLSVLMKQYGFGIEFCDKRSTGKRILELLGGADGE